MVEKKLILIAGSPSGSSRSLRLLQAVEERLRLAGVGVRLVLPEQLGPQALLRADTADVNVAEFIQLVSASDGIVVATPVYKATFSGVLKVALDVIPPDALVGKVAFGIATGRLPQQLKGAGSALGGIFDFFRVRTQVAPLLLADEAIFDAADSTRFSTTTHRLLDSATEQLLNALK